jgi:hypothetical protein
VSFLELNKYRHTRLSSTTTGVPRPGESDDRAVLHRSGPKREGAQQQWQVRKQPPRGPHAVVVVVVAGGGWRWWWRCDYCERHGGVRQCLTGQSNQKGSRK